MLGAQFPWEWDVFDPQNTLLLRVYYRTNFAALGKTLCGAGKGPK